MSLTGRARDEDGSFQRFVAGSTGSLARLAYLLCGDHHLADDLVQNALIRMYHAWPRIERSEAVDAYARKVLLRCWLAERRKPWRRKESRQGDLPDPPDELADPANQVGPAHLRDVVGRALAQVPPRQRAAVVLRYWSQLSVAETAAALRCSEGTVKSQTARGLATLRTALAEADPADEKSLSDG